MKKSDLKRIQNQQNDVTEFLDPATGEITYLSPRFRTPYDGTRVRSPITFSEPTKTKQEFKDQCDVNKIVANFLKTGRLDALDASRAIYADLSAGPQDYQQALNLVLDARDAFDELPSDIRAKYHNSVHEFLAACQNDPNAVYGELNPVQADKPNSATTLPDAPDKAPPAQPDAKQPPLQTAE